LEELPETESQVLPDLFPVTRSFYALNKSILYTHHLTSVPVNVTESAASCESSRLRVETHPLQVLRAHLEMKPHFILDLLLDLIGRRRQSPKPIPPNQSLSFTC
jgi:hypothetical protein